MNESADSAVFSVLLVLAELREGQTKESDLEDADAVLLD